MAISQDAPLLAAIDVFRSLTREQLLELEVRLSPITIAGGTRLVNQGEEADALFLVVTGRFEVLIDGQPNPIAEIGAGSTIGEIAFFAGGQRIATVKAQRDSLVLKLSRADFEELAGRFPQMWSAITATLAQRLATTTSRGKPRPVVRPKTIAVCPAGSAPLDPGFIASLRSVFERHARTVFLDATTWRIALKGRSPCDSAAVETAWFNELERDYDFVFYVADSQPSDWSHKVIRQADMVVCAGRQRAGLSPAERRPNALEDLVAGLHKPENVRLVLVHDQSGAAQGTRGWLDTRPAIGLHHHVGCKVKADYERLYRFLSGNALGLVACGGGAFSSAHIGLFQAFQEAGLAFDMMGGTSGGAAMTAAFALVADPDEIERRTHDIFVARKALRRWTLPRYSLLDHSEFDRALRHHFTDADIEDLWIPFFAVSTNLSRNTIHIHRRGPLWQAVRASCSIPALLPPVFTADGEMLVDGCLMDNVPINAMHAAKSGPNIVVDFNVPDAGAVCQPGTHLPSRRELLWASLTKSRRQQLPQFPSPAAVLLRSLMLNRSKVHAALGPDDVLLEPDMPGDMNHLDWHRHSQLRREAYAFATVELHRLAGAGHPIFSCGK